MNLSTLTAKHLREVFFGGNWTSVNLKQTLEGINWQQAVTSADGLNSIAALVYHINYYVSAVLQVFEGDGLNAHDKYSFNLGPVNNQEDWETLQDKAFGEAEKLAAHIEQLPDEKFEQVFVDEKFGSYFRNMYGIIEHTHYHLGQIAILKKMIVDKNLQ